MIIAFVLGLVIGAPLGFLVAALCAAAAQADRAMEDRSQRRR